MSVKCGQLSINLIKSWLHWIETELTCLTSLLTRLVPRHSQEPEKKINRNYILSFSFLLYLLIVEIIWFGQKSIPIIVNKFNTNLIWLKGNKPVKMKWSSKLICCFNQIQFEWSKRNEKSFSATIIILKLPFIRLSWLLKSLSNCKQSKVKTIAG